MIVREYCYNEDGKKINLRRISWNLYMGKNDWKTLRRGQEKSYLLTNSKAGYSALSMIGSCSRGEHNPFMACIKAPNTWVQMITKMEEIIQVGGKQ